MAPLTIDRDKIISELVGVPNSTWTGVTTWQSIAGAGTFPAVLVRRPNRGVTSLVVIMRVKYGASVPGAAPKIDFFGAMGDHLDLQDSTTQPFATLTMQTPVISAQHQKSLVLTNLDKYPFYSWQITNGATNAAEFFVSIIEVYGIPS